MTQLDMLTTLVDAARLVPENRHLNSAIKLAERVIERKRGARADRLRRESAFAATGAFSESGLKQISQANRELMVSAGRCPGCGFIESRCVCARLNL